MKRLWGWASLLGFWGWGCGEPPPPPPPEAGEALRWVEVEERAGGFPAWRLRARTILRRGETLWVYPVELAFLDRRDTLSFLTADSGWVLESSGWMTALGNVRVVTREDTIHTEKIVYDPRKRVIRSPVYARIAQRDRVVESSSGFETDPALKNIRFPGPVRVEGREGKEP